MAKRNLPKWKQIINFWQMPVLMKFYPLAYSKKWAENHKPLWDDKFCFACGLPGYVERCHIIAKHSGGTDDVSNLHLLCAGCHKESEFLEGDLYWKWFNSVDPVLAFKAKAQRFKFLITSDSIQLK